MPSNIDQPPLLPSTGPGSQMPLNIAGIVELLRQQKNSVIAVQLVDALQQMYLMFAVIWKVLKTQLPEIDAIQLLGTDGNAVVNIDPGGISITDPTDPTKLILMNFSGINLSEGTASQVLIQASGGVAYVRITGAFGAIDIAAGPASATVDMPAGATISIGGNAVLTDQQATVAAVAGTAGATYTGTEQTLINDLKTAVNNLILRLQGMGTIA